MLPPAADRLRHMHDCGLDHGDLNLKNILVSRTDFRQLFIIDWDKSTHSQDALDLDDRQRNVIWFCRSSGKLRIRGIRVPEQFADIFLEKYWHNPDMAQACRNILQQTLNRRRVFWHFLR
jgi:tRNA A-37 threonylcarbamoyl transferase component Bud32